MAFGHFSFGLSPFHGHGSWLMCEVALRASLDYGEEVHRSRILEEWSNYDWLRNGFSTNHGLHYGQDLFDGKHQAWMKKLYDCQHGNTFCLGRFSGGQVLGQPQNPCTRNLASKELRLEAFFNCYFPSCLL
jgi:hypothetical protein